jgi:hypothetical protein
VSNRLAISARFLSSSPLSNSVPQNRRVDRLPIEPRGGCQLGERDEVQRQHVVIVEQPAVEPRDRLWAEGSVPICHGAEQLAQHGFAQIRLLCRLVEQVGEKPVGQEVDVLGEQAEHQLVDEMRDPPLVILPAQQQSDPREAGGGLRRYALAGRVRPQPLGMQKAVAQQPPLWRVTEIAELNNVLLGDRVGEIPVDTNFLHVRHDQERRIAERIGVLLQLRVGLDEVLCVALVFPNEAAVPPDIGIARLVADLAGVLLEIVTAPPRLFDAKQIAQIEEMLLGRRAFRAGIAAPFGVEFFRRHPAIISCGPVVPQANRGCPEQVRA